MGRGKTLKKGNDFNELQGSISAVK